MFITLAVAIALLAIGAGVLIMRRMAEAERRSYIAELDLHSYDVNLDTPQRRNYDELLEAESEGNATTNALIVALLNRAAAVLPYVEKVERDRPRLHKLHRHSYVPTKVLDELMSTEFELQHEVDQVRAEAERLRPGWGTAIFAQAWRIEAKRRAEASAAAGQRQRGAGSWSQSPTHMSMALPLPEGVTAAHVQVQFERETCLIIVGSHNPRRLHLEQPVKPDDCSYDIREDDNTLTVLLAKETPAMWKAPSKAAS
jgi:hypothetical protein